MATKRAAQQFRLFIVRPTLMAIGLHSQAAENLLVGTAVHESDLECVDQWLGADDHTLGPAIGPYQMEAATLHDIYDNFLNFRDVLRAKVDQFRAPLPRAEEQLATNAAYATVMARIRYARAPAPLPKADDVDGLAAYWKQHYNTPLGKGDPKVWAQEYRAVCG